MRFAVALRNAQGDPIVKKRILLFTQFWEMIRIPHCEPWWMLYQSPGDGSHLYVADWLDPEIFTVDSPRADK
jgi:hypothetical protein